MYSLLTAIFVTTLFFTDIIPPACSFVFSFLFLLLILAAICTAAADFFGILSMIPGQYCMCHLHWGPGETLMEKTMFGGWGGSIVYHRPEICVNWC